MAADDKTLIPLSQIAYEARAAGYESVRHRSVYQLIVDGRVYAEMRKARWHLRRDDLPMIAEALGWTRESAKAETAA